MSNIAEILRKVDSIQGNPLCKNEVDANDLYRRGIKCYHNKDFDGASYWWEQAARKHHEKSKKALLDLYFKERRDMMNFTHITTYSEAKGRKWPISTGREGVWLYTKNL
ncbi:MAG: hypothetical protein J5798_13990 [Spirochaetaceae bacterium]|nr:hypothetical protein [Spirochaetaceae bacterium]